MRPYRLVALCLSLLLPTASFAEDDPRLAELLQPLIAAHQGTVSVAVKHLTSGVTFAHRADEPMPTASLIKFPVMIAAYQQAADGKIDLAKPVVLKDEDKVPGSGILTQHFSAGAQLSVRDAIRLMIVYSDNTATNLVVDQIGLAATTELMAKWEFPHTRLHSKVYRGDTSIAPERSKHFGLGSTTAGEMLRLLERLQRKELVSEEASKQMYEHLLACGRVAGQERLRDAPVLWIIVPRGFAQGGSNRLPDLQSTLTPPKLSQHSRERGIGLSVSMNRSALAI